MKITWEEPPLTIFPYFVSSYREPMVLSQHLSARTFPVNSSQGLPWSMAILGATLDSGNNREGLERAMEFLKVPVRWDCFQYNRKCNTLILFGKRFHLNLPVYLWENPILEPRKLGVMGVKYLLKSRLPEYLGFQHHTTSSQQILFKRLSIKIYPRVQHLPHKHTHWLSYCPICSLWLSSFDVANVSHFKEFWLYKNLEAG